MDKIRHYVVRRSGCTAWKTGIESEAEAHEEAIKAQLVTRLVHHVYAVHRSGNVTGPYYKDDESCIT